MYLNKAFIIGNLTRDPELKAIPSGIKVCSFSVATNRVWKDKNGAKQEAADYHNVVVPKPVVPFKPFKNCLTYTLLPS
jgi:single-strand DNA-binding protein